MSAAPADWPEDVAAVLQDHEIVAITSGITDLREAEELLNAQRPGRWQRVEWGMGSAENRARFHALQQRAGFSMLPMFLHRDGVIGGLPELRRHLHEPRPAAAAASNAPATGAPTPLLALLGYSGLIPFFFFGAIAWVLEPPWQAFALHALGAYAVVILSFLGAVHWGLYLADRRHRVLGASGPVWAVIPAVAAWLAWLLPLTPALVIFALLFPLVFAVDRVSLDARRLPPGYIKLRGYLTVGALITLVSGVFASLSA